MKAANVVLYIPFEHLTADHSGPETLQKLAHLLQSVNVTVPDDDAIECLWKHLVKDAPKKKRSKTYTPGWTMQQKTAMVKMLNGLLALPWILNETDNLAEVLVSYRNDIDQDLLVDWAAINTTSG